MEQLTISGESQVYSNLLFTFRPKYRPLFRCLLMQLGIEALMYSYIIYPNYILSSTFLQVL